MKHLRPQSWLRMGLLLALGVLVLASLNTLVPATLADLATAKARAEITQWTTRGTRLPLADMVKWRDSLSEGLAHTPDDALLHSQLGLLFGHYAVQARAVPDVSRDFYSQAYQRFDRALILRPMSAELALNAAVAAEGRGQVTQTKQTRDLSCRARKYTSPSVKLPDRLRALPDGACS
ncbi:hypothetical protein PSQ39_08080 [Curvibacter sp. HBC28]|uniref:Uncharacterized protein n=1 Tax=Curvibacter microcysteis TaxID=3026419 RepID=A0ABT5MDD1_9BURK|nr:hypothetical protein [Curvibacter sp. HBC28]MDD0814584.1 hypothetical protein [Curvibacter sp. HBC28]